MLTTRWDGHGLGSSKELLAGGAGGRRGEGRLRRLQGASVEVFALAGKGDGRHHEGDDDHGGARGLLRVYNGKGLCDGVSTSQVWGALVACRRESVLGCAGVDRRKQERSGGVRFSQGWGG